MLPHAHFLPTKIGPPCGLEGPLVEWYVLKPKYLISLHTKLQACLNTSLLGANPKWYTIKFKNTWHHTFSFQA